MKIIAFDTLNEGITFNDLKPHLKEEAKQTWKLYEKGIVREFYLRADDKPGAVVVLECKDVNEAKNHMNELPLVKNSLITFEYIPLQYFMPFSTLFAAE